MHSLEAKDFLVKETVKQAALEGAPFSDLERRMMYFVENEEMREDPLKLNDEFEAQYDSDEYEAKVSKLMHHAYARVKKENPEAARRWNEALQVLSMGDHYLPVLWGGLGPSQVPASSWITLLERLAVLALAIYASWFALRYFMRVTGVSSGAIFGVVFIVTLIAVGIKPAMVSKVAQRAFTRLKLFLIGRRDSGN